MKKLLAIALTVLASIAAQDAFAQRGAVYDFMTGNIKLTAEGGEISFSVFAEDSLLNRPGATDLGGAAQSTDVTLPGSVTWANFGGFASGEYDAGNIILPMTDPSAVTAQAQLNFAGDIADVPVEVTNFIPEPATLSLVGLGLVGLSVARRRR